MDGKKESGDSMMSAWLKDDDDDDEIGIFTCNLINMYKLLVLDRNIWNHIIGYRMPNPVHTYISNEYNFKDILVITFLNELELIFLHTVKWIQVFLSSTNNFIYF